MSDTEIKKIETAYLNYNYQEVIETWERARMKNEVFEFSRDSSFRICDAVAGSYFFSKRYRESLKIVNKRIDFLLSEKGKSDFERNDYFNFNYYFGLKSAIYRNLGYNILSYKTLLEYKKRDGKREQVLNFIPEMEQIIYEHIFNPLYSIYFPVVYSLIILIYHFFHLKVLHSFYIGFIFIGLLIIMLTIVAMKWIKKYTIILFKRIVYLFIYVHGNVVVSN